MKKRSQSTRTALLVSVTALLVVALLLLVYFQAVRKKTSQGIVLPPDGSAVSPPLEPNEPDEKLFLTVDKDNVLQIIRSLTRPAYYHQSMTATLYWAEGQVEKTIDLYCRGTVVKAVIQEPGQTKSMLSDGQTVYVWYDGDETAFQTQLQPGATLEELLGIPTYETVLSLPEDAVIEASYLTLGDAEPTACIYLSCRLTPDGYTDRYWIDVKNQMLYRADAQFKDEQFYAVQQTAITVYSENDDTVTWDFKLPDGTEPFSKALTEIETPQPSE